jgi:CBS-domain-containing membrane protein
MTREVVTVSPETPAPQVVDRMESHQVKRVPVLRDGKVVGITAAPIYCAGSPAWPTRLPRSLLRTASFASKS